MNSETYRLSTILPSPLTGQGPSYTCGILAKEMAIFGLPVTVVTPRARAFNISPACVVQILPRWARYVPYRWVRSSAQREIENRFVKYALNPETKTRAAYIFADTTVETVVKLKERGITIFREQINCPRKTAKAILDDAYERLALTPGHAITNASAKVEQELLREVDYIFCPNAMVEKSLLENGVPSSKLISASYGWDPKRFSGADKLLRPSEGITAVFVGAICVRKGAHLLLEYWAQSGVKGRLILAGKMEPAIKDKCAQLLARDDVIVLDFVNNVGALYRSADIFVFPSLEEGGPQVTYEACGCGLPAITTPMGAGRIIRNEQEGLLIDAYDRDGWISAIQLLAADSKLRQNMAQAAKSRAGEFVWNVVASRRAKQIAERLKATRQGVRV